MLRVGNIKLMIYESEMSLKQKVAQFLKCAEKDISSLEINKKSLDARNALQIMYVYTVDVEVKNEGRYTSLKNVSRVTPYIYPIVKVESKIRPVIIGSGPAGLLAGIILAEAGLKPLIIERGKCVSERKIDIYKFWETGILDTNSNVQFGAGGAGTFSDGKLTTGVNNERRDKLLDELILAGAPKEIKYIAKPHIGTDILIKVVDKLIKKIEKLGGEIVYNTQLVNMYIEDDKLCAIDLSNQRNITKMDCSHLILAIGHSARDTFEMIYEKGMKIKAKSFSVGVRIEHLQSEVNQCQLGELSSQLPTAEYKLNTHLESGRSVYTFCMCPGGVVVAASSEENRVVTNGMSYYARDLVNANSALLVSVNPSDFDGDIHPLNGMKFQRELEEKAFKLGGSNYYAPAQKVGDFINNVSSIEFNKVIPSYQPGVKASNLRDCLPDFVCDAIQDSLSDLASKMSVFADSEAVMTAVESRSSSPITIERDEDYMSNIYGIIPCGEGAGFAGGIVSAGLDGIKCAEKMIAAIKLD